MIKLEDPSGGRSRQKTFYPAFDFIRCAAAVGVFLAHADKGHILPVDFGNACVQVFFALSGYLIGGILLASEPRDLPRFFFNRTTRIWIPYALSIALLAAVTAVKQGFSEPKFGEFFFYMVTFVYNWFGPPQLAQHVHQMPLDGTGNGVWSICVEEQFYLVAPFLLLFLTRWMAAGFMVCVVALNFFSPHYFASIALGVLLAMTDRSVLFAGLALCIAAISAMFSPYVVWMPFLAVSIVGFAAIEGKPSALGRVLGGASYSFYLNHWVGLFVLFALYKRGLPFAVCAAIGFSISASISVMHYAVVDRWIARNRGSWFTKPVGWTSFSAGVSLVLVGLGFGLFYFQDWRSP